MFYLFISIFRDVSRNHQISIIKEAFKSELCVLRLQFPRYPQFFFGNSMIVINGFSAAITWGDTGAFVFVDHTYCVLIMYKLNIVIFGFQERFSLGGTKRSDF